VGVFPLSIFELISSDIAKEFPGTPLQTLKDRYRKKKAKLREWSAEEVRARVSES